MPVQTLKGFRDFLPKEARKRQYVIATLKKVFESYGFEPLETPALEYEEILLGKYGDEGDKLMYRFEDNGGRRVALRYDQTVPLSRVVAQYQSELTFPFKRYQVQNVWRAENTQRGRYREFLQCDIDIAGSDTAGSDAEIITVVAKGFDALGVKNYKILLNDRTIFGETPIKAIMIVDKLKKIGEEGVRKELQQNGFDPEILTSIKNAKITERLSLTKKIVKNMGVPEDKLVFEPTLARGLDYYTGLIIEVEITEYPVGSVGGGGRYDNLIGMFSSKQVPAVGFAFGFDRVMDALEVLDLFPTTLNQTKVLVTIFNVELADTSAEIANMLREKGIATELWLDPTTKMEKQLKYADQKDIQYAVIIGSEEIEKNVVTLKNLKTREQKQILLKDLPNEIT